MKKSMFVFAMLSVLPFIGANAHEYTTTRYVKSSGSGRSNTIVNNFYYNYGGGMPRAAHQPMPARSSGMQPVQKKSGYVGGIKKSSSHSKKSYKSEERKFFLAHPFFQPLKGHFGSVTDVYFAQNNFKFDMLDSTVIDAATNAKILSGALNLSGKASTEQTSVKEDFSFGITDTLAVVVMGQFDSTKVKIDDWSDGLPGNSRSNSGLNIFGIGLQSRLVDNANYIATVSGFYHHQKDTANTFIGELKAGYKVNRTTMYGIVRAGYSKLIEGDAYGAYVADGGDWLLLAYKTNIHDISYIEGGAGLFSVMNKYVTLNGELTLGNYDWHNQLNLKGSIGWQPADSFALNLYASGALYDSAKNQVKEYINYDFNPDTSAFPAEYSGVEAVYATGNYKIRNYNEWKIGVQAILYF